MKSLLIRVTIGLHQKDVEDKQMEYIDDWQERGFLLKKDNIYKLHSKYRAGKVTAPSADGSTYVQVLALNVRDLLVDSADLSGAVEGDLVILERFLGRSRSAPSAKVVQIVCADDSFSVAYLKSTQDSRSIVDIKSEHPAGVELSSDYLDQFEDGTLFKISNKMGKIVEVLGNLSDPLVDEKIVLAMYNRHDEFEDDVLELAKSFSEDVDVSKHTDRKDLTHLPFCTIDPVTAKDFDDAICFIPSSNTLYVAIADVSAYVTPFGAIDAEAIYRSFSIYLPHRSIPMLPRVLSERLCSLQPDVNRLAYVFEMQLNSETFEVDKSTLFEAVIHSRRRFTYEEIDSFFEHKLDTDTEDKDVVKYLLPLKNLTDELRTKRLINGFDFHSEELEMKLDSFGLIEKMEVAVQTPSHSLIEECMLLANKEAASMFKRGVFRIHDEPSNSSLQNLYLELASIGIIVDIKDNLRETVRAIQSEAASRDLVSEVDTLIIKAQMRAKYSPDNSAHFGLGFEKYTHFTSPIRRYSDLIVHRLLKAIQAEDTEESSYVLRNIDALCFAISDKEREVADIEFKFMDRKFARWASEHVGESFLARVVGVESELKAQILEPIYGAKVTLHSSEEVELFQDIFVTIKSANIATTKITASHTKSRDV